MTLSHEQLLAQIESRACCGGADFAEVDQRIAAELAVPVEAYLAYVLVWGALETRRQAILTGGTVAPQPPTASDRTVRCLRLAGAIGALAAGVYRDAARRGDAGFAATAASRILGHVLQLRTNLTHLVDGDGDGGVAAVGASEVS